MSDENESVVRVVRRDYWTMAGELWIPISGVVHDTEQDKYVDSYDLVKKLFLQAGVKDGDEVEILMTKTDRRPFGDRRFLIELGVGSRAETDEECLRRIEEDGNESNTGKV